MARVYSVLASRDNKVRHFFSHATNRTLCGIHKTAGWQFYFPEVSERVTWVEPCRPCVAAAVRLASEGLLAPTPTNSSS